MKMADEPRNVRSRRLTLTVDDTERPMREKHSASEGISNPDTR